jgi:hypothetical protein
MADLKIISLGAGLQSSALYFMSSIGELPRADYAICADPGREKKGTYEYLEFMKDWAKLNNGIPIIIVNRKNLYVDLLNQTNSTGQRFSPIPCFTLGEDGSKGMLRRQCTYEYKIMQVDWQIRQLYGLKPRQWTPKTFVWQGITTDEIERMSFSESNWKVKVYPFIGYQATKTDTEKLAWGIKKNRNECETWFTDREMPVPPKSSCTFCPYQSDLSWFELKTNDPDEFEICCQVDEAIRNSTKKGIKNPAFLHESCVPLREVKFNQLDVWRGTCATECHI